MSLNVGGGVSKTFHMQDNTHQGNIPLPGFSPRDCVLVKQTILGNFKIAPPEKNRNAAFVLFSAIIKPITNKSACIGNHQYDLRIKNV